MTKLYMLLSSVIALVLHLVFGWQYAIVGAIVAGALNKKHPVLAGMLTLLATWLGLVVYSFIVAPQETSKMAVVMGAIFGIKDGISPFVTILMTVGIAALLGAAGGWLGSAPIRKK